MYSCAYGIRNIVLLICFKSSIVLCIGPYSCLLLGICSEYANWGYCVLCIGCALGNVASSYALPV
jgi:hypothetical protein